MSTKKIGFTALVLALATTTPAVAATSHTSIGAACHYENEQTAEHTRTNHRFNNTSGEARWTTCPAVVEVESNLTSASLDFKPPATDLRLDFRQPDGALLAWAPDREVYVKPDGSLRRAEWFVNTVGGMPGASAISFEAKLGADAFILKYTVTQ